MYPKKHMRNYEIFINGEWQEVDVRRLAPDDIIRIFEHDGSPVLCNEHSIFVVQEINKISVEIFPTVYDALDFVDRTE